jgi:hypothetical protein
MYKILRKKDFDVRIEKLNQEALLLELELLDCEIIPYSEAIETLRTTK